MSMLALWYRGDNGGGSECRGTHDTSISMQYINIQHDADAWHQIYWWEWEIRKIIGFYPILRSSESNHICLKFNSICDLAKKPENEWIVKSKAKKKGNKKREGKRIIDNLYVAEPKYTNNAHTRKYTEIKWWNEKRELVELTATLSVCADKARFQIVL